MDQGRRARLELLSALLSGAVSVLAALDAIGKPTRAVHVLTIFAGGAAFGVSLAKSISRRRALRARRDGPDPRVPDHPSAPASDAAEP